MYTYVATVSNNSSMVATGIWRYFLKRSKKIGESVIGLASNLNESKKALRNLNETSFNFILR